jgi:uncharacterized protein
LFGGREKDNHKLFNSDKFEFAVIYDRCRVGKTALINKFIDNKNAIYYMGVENNKKQNLKSFQAALWSMSAVRRLTIHAD